MNLKIKTITEIIAPKGTFIITNNDWITLMRKKSNKKIISIFTCLTEDISNHDLMDEKNWLDLSKTELKLISKYSKQKGVAK